MKNSVILKNQSIFDALTLMEKLAALFDIDYDWSNIYPSIISNIKKRLSEETHILLPDSLRTEIISYLNSLNIPHLQENLFKILDPFQSIEVANEDFVNSLTVKRLNNKDLIRYFVFVVKTITFTQKDNLLLVKYNNSIYNTGWSELAKVCRGKVIDLTTKLIVSYPFDKFFNLNETEETLQYKVEEQIKMSSKISVTDKKDGSLICITKIKNCENPLITTNGSFCNTQIQLARAIFENKYNFFYKSLPTDKSFIFELISPNDPHIINYGNREELCLLGIRDLSTFELADYDEMVDFARHYGLDYTESYNFTNLNEFLSTAMGKYDNKEGWVFRIVGCDFDNFFKLKFHEYFLLHRTISSISIQKVYKLVVGNILNEYFEQCSDKIRDDALSLIEDINIIKVAAQNFIEKRALELLEKNDLTVETFANDKDKMVKFIKQVLQDEPYGSEIIYYIKTPELKSKLFYNYPPKKFENMLIKDFG